MSHETEHDRRMKTIEADPTLMHDFNLISLITGAGPEIVAEQVFEIARRDSPALRNATRKRA